MRPLAGLITLAVMCPPGFLQAQEPATDRTRVSAFPGLGGGAFQSLDGAPNDPGVALLGGVAVQRREHLFTLRGSLVAEVLADGVADVGVLYGRT